MNKRKLKLDEYGISSKRYAELKMFCEQYPEWKDELLVKGNPLKGAGYSDMPRGSFKQSSETEEISIRCVELDRKCDLIDEAAKKSAEDLWEYMIKNVCYNKPFAYLQTIMHIPCSERSFYDKRRYFFYLLDKTRK